MSENTPGEGVGPAGPEAGSGPRGGRPSNKRPLLDPPRRFIPLISGIDLSPLVAILLLQAVLIFL